MNNKKPAQRRVRVYAWLILKSNATKRKLVCCVTSPMNTVNAPCPDIMKVIIGFGYSDKAAFFCHVVSAFVGQFVGRDF